MIVILDLHVKYLNFNINSIVKYSNRKDGRIEKTIARNDTVCSPEKNNIVFKFFLLRNENIF